MINVQNIMKVNIRINDEIFGDLCRLFLLNARITTNKKIHVNLRDKTTVKDFLKKFFGIDEDYDTEILGFNIELKDDTVVLYFKKIRIEIENVPVWVKILFLFNTKSIELSTDEIKFELSKFEKSNKIISKFLEIFNNGLNIKTTGEVCKIIIRKRDEGITIRIGDTMLILCK